MAQERTAERDLVEAFSAYCVATTADPARVKVAVEKVGKWVLVGLSAEKIRDHWGEVEEAKISTAPVQGHPHHKMLVEVGSGLGDSGRRRTCRVNMPGGDKVRLLAETPANLATGDGASDVVKEGGFKIDVTRKQTGERVKMDEVGLYTVRSGKIVEERFFY